MSRYTDEELRKEYEKWTGESVDPTMCIYNPDVRCDDDSPYCTICRKNVKAPEIDES